MTDIQVQITGGESVIVALNMLFLDSTRKAEMMDQIGSGLVSGATQRFIDQVSPDGVAWLPSQRAIAENGQTLRDTGRLMASITHVLTGDDVEYGTNVEYAKTMHFGHTFQRVARTSGVYFKQHKEGTVSNKFVKKSKSNFAQDVQIGAHSVTIAARPFLGISSDDKTMMIDVISQFLGQS